MKGLVWMIEYDRLERRGKEKYLDRAVLAGRGYVRRRLLGTGTFSDVYCVEDIADGKRYACKVSSQVEMLEREARILEGLRHPIYPGFTAFVREAGLGLLLREYVEGYSLEEVLKRRRFSAGQTVRMGLMLADGLWYLHQLPERFLFRDVKPANIIVMQDGRVRLIDLGCVCSMAEEVTSRAGSPGFAAPEQLQAGGCLTAACDVYGLGKTLEAMLGEGKQGGRKYPADGPAMTGWHGMMPACRRKRTGLQKAGLRRRPFQEQRMERRLRRVLASCTEKEVGKRIADMKEVMQALAAKSLSS
nr:serine/threonine-protein kinase [uncultured Acetatifactor sp.]